MSLEYTGAPDTLLAFRMRSASAKLDDASIWTTSEGERKADAGMDFRAEDTTS